MSWRSRGFFICLGIEEIDYMKMKSEHLKKKSKTNKIRHKRAFLNTMNTVMDKIR